MKPRLPIWPPAGEPGPAPAAPPDGGAGATRRQVLRVATTAAAAGAALASLAIVDRRTGSRAGTPRRMRDHRAARAAGAVDMAIARGPDPAANVRRAIEALGGMRAFVRPGESVAIKPNAGWNRLPEQAANSNPDVVAAVVRMVAAAGAARIWVADVPVNDPDRCFERSGIRRAVGQAGGTLVLPDASGFQEVEVGGRALRVAEVLRPFVDADRIINIPVAKQHGLSRATLAMKNWIGVLGGARVRLHQDIHRAIAELAVLMKPTLTVLDATRVLVGNGPTGGSLDDVRRMDTVVAAVDQVAVDAFGASLLGLAPADVGFITEAEKAGIGRSDFRSLKLVEVAG